MSTHAHRDPFEGLIEEVDALRQELIGLAEDSQDLLNEVHASHRLSAENLLHYVAFRGSDLRDLQKRLAQVGLSSLGRAESHVLSGVDAVRAVLHRALQRPLADDMPRAGVDLETGQTLLATHTEALLGAVPPERGVAIMVTLPSEAANDYTLIHRLVERGMDCARINCAHDDETAWARMVDHVRRAGHATGRTCRILMDLAGPKIRTGPVAPGPPVVKIKPTRDALGRVLQPARVWLVPDEQPRASPTPADATVALPQAFLSDLAVGDRLRFRDARDTKGSLRVVAVGPDGCWATGTRTCYLTPGLPVRLHRDGTDELGEAPIGAMPATAGTIPVVQGDLLLLTRELAPGRGAIRDQAGRVLTPATVGCTSPQVFEDAAAGERVWIDDGKIGCVIERKEWDRLHLRVTHAPPRGAKIAADKGINFPDTHLHLEAMTDKDRLDLPFVSSHADMVRSRS